MSAVSPDLWAVGLAYPVSTVVGTASFLLSPLVLAYRWDRTPSVRRWLDGLQRRFTGQPDWRWLRLWHLMVPLAVITVANIVFQVSTLSCSDDSLAILASGRAALAGHNPFLVTYCGGGSPAQIPYGAAEVAVNALGALSNSVAGMWVVWQLLALAVVPLVWAVGGADRRYLAALTATSVLYLPNIATNIGVENAIVPVSTLAMLWALGRPGPRGWLGKGLASFLATARFPALFPLLGASAPLRTGRWRQTTLVLGVFLGAVGTTYLIWGPSAIQVVYLGQFARASNESLNFFAVLLAQSWFQATLASAAIQGAGLLALVLLVNWRGYSAAAACGLPLLGVMALSQYLTFHFVLWIVPCVLLGAAVNRGLYVYAALAWLDENVALATLAWGRNIWWPYELLGLVLFAILVYLIVRVVRDEERRLRAVGRGPPAASAAPPS
jgi:hypothetical protein